jgi:hypothetical protein
MRIKMKALLYIFLLPLMVLPIVIWLLPPQQGNKVLFIRVGRNGRSEKFPWPLGFSWRSSEASARK